MTKDSQFQPAKINRVSSELFATAAVQGGTDEQDFDFIWRPLMG